MCWGTGISSVCRRSFHFVVVSLFEYFPSFVWHFVEQLMFARRQGQSLLWHFVLQSQVAVEVLLANNFDACTRVILFVLSNVIPSNIDGWIPDIGTSWCAAYKVSSWPNGVRSRNIGILSLSIRSSTRHGMIFFSQFVRSTLLIGLPTISPFKSQLYSEYVHHIASVFSLVFSNNSYVQLVGCFHVD